MMEPREVVAVGGRIRGEQVRRSAYTAAALGAAVGAIIAGGLVFITMHRDPYQPGTGPCADAAERWAQVDLMVKDEYQPLRPGSDVLAPSDVLILARGEARDALEACRAAGS